MPKTIVHADTLSGKLPVSAGARLVGVRSAITRQVMKIGRECGAVVRSGNYELRIQNYERRRQSVAKRVAPNEAELRARARPGR